MNRTTRYIVLSIAAAALLAPAAGLMAAESRRPNILFAFADDWGHYASVYSQSGGRGTPNDVIRTPNFDRIAREGVLFNNAFVPAPSCTPCRSSLLSGQYFWRTGHGAILYGVWDSSIPTYPRLLHAAGYHVGKTYKAWGPGTPAHAPHGGKEFVYDKAGRRFNQFSQNVTKMVARGMTVPAAKQVLYDEARGNFEAFLADRQPGQPFCYWFGPTNTHRKWTKGSGKTLWGIDPDSLKGKMPKFLPDVHEIRQDMADYLGEAQAFDAPAKRTGPRMHLGQVHEDARESNTCGTKPLPAVGRRERARHVNDLLMHVIQDRCVGPS